MFKVNNFMHKYIKSQEILSKLSYRLQNIVTLVTGGASGLGLGTVNRFAKKGAKVIMTDLPSSNGVEVAKVIGHDVRYIPADIRSEIDLKNLIDEIDKTYGQLNVVVNCAGIANAHIIHNYNRGACRNLDNFMDVIQVSLYKYSWQFEQ